MPISLETIYKDIARELFAEFPDSHWGPGHVVLEDGNWDAYQQAIDFCHLVLAYRGLSALGLSTLAVFGLEQFEIVYKLDFYADHSTVEVAETLAALELIRWHEEGHQGGAHPRNSAPSRQKIPHIGE